MTPRRRRQLDRTIERELMGELSPRQQARLHAHLRSWRRWPLRRWLRRLPGPVTLPERPAYLQPLPEPRFPAAPPARLPAELAPCPV